MSGPKLKKKSKSPHQREGLDMLQAKAEEWFLVLDDEWFDGSSHLQCRFCRSDDVDYGYDNDLVIGISKSPSGVKGPGGFLAKLRQEFDRNARDLYPPEWTKQRHEKNLAALRRAEEAERRSAELRESGAEEAPRLKPISEIWEEVKLGQNYLNMAIEQLYDAGGTCVLQAHKDSKSQAAHVLVYVNEGGAK